VPGYQGVVAISDPSMEYYIQRGFGKARFLIPKNERRLIDLTSYLELKELFLQLYKLQEGDIYLKVRDGVKVRVEEGYDFHQKIHVLRENGDHSIARNYPYFANGDMISINTLFSFVEPMTSPVFTEVVGDEVYEAEAQLQSTDHRIVCRHLAQHNIQMRLAPELGFPADWKVTRHQYYREKAIHEVFHDQTRFEYADQDIWCTDIYRSSTDHFGIIVRELAQEFFFEPGKELAAEEEREQCFYVVNKGGVHACAMVLIAKRKHDNYTFKLKWYEPNISRNHMSFACEDIRDFDKLDYHKLTINMHRDQNNSIFFFAVKPEYAKEGHLQPLIRHNGRVAIYHFNPDGEAFFYKTKASLTVEETLESYGYKRIDK
jgi:hypothetical protein